LIKNSEQPGNNKTGKVLINFEVRSIYYFCGRRAVSFAQSECVSVALVNEHTSACVVLYCYL
jgi:hypothetical protein